MDVMLARGLSLVHIFEKEDLIMTKHNFQLPYDISVVEAPELDDSCPYKDAKGIAVLFDEETGTFIFDARPLEKMLFSGK